MLINGRFRFRCVSSTFAVAAILSLCSTAGYAEGKLGSVDFQTSCNPVGNAAFNEGLTLLHHMMYVQAESAFDRGIEEDSDCAMLYWGVGMANFHPLWPGVPMKEETERGNAAAEKLRTMQNVSPVERKLIDAVLAFYDPDNENYRDSVTKWASAQADAFAAFSDNIDVATLYALAQLSTAPRGDGSMERERATGDLLDSWYERAPEHPGVIHYAIHAYDNPPLAERGLKYARIYDQIAPNVPHALHMPSHIFVRLGLWKEAVAWNARSAAAAKAQPHNGIISNHYAHAMDYGIYAQLQLGEFDKAEAMLKEFLSVQNLQPSFASAYALAASPVRVLLEQEKWSEAASVSTPTLAGIPWDKFPQCESMLWFGRGIGAVRSGDTSGAAHALVELEKLHKTLVDAKQGYWATLTESQILSIEAWQELTNGNSELAVELQSKAADIEDAVGKSPVTPGHVLPARELLGDLFRKIGDETRAQKAYSDTLAVSPNRRRSLTYAG